MEDITHDESKIQKKKKRQSIFHFKGNYISLSTMLYQIPKKKKKKTTQLFFLEDKSMYSV